MELNKNKINHHKNNEIQIIDPGLPISPTLAINQKTKELIEKGQNVVRWGFGESPFKPHSSMLKIIGEKAYQASYEDTRGIKKLRELICEYLNKRFIDIETEPDFVFITDGSKSALKLLSETISGPIFLPYASWVSYEPQALLAKKDIIWIPTQKENMYKLSPQDLISKMSNYSKDQQKILIINSPNNPTGLVYSKEEIKQISKVCREYNIYIIHDMIYAYFKDFENNDFISFSSFIPERTILTYGLSKVFHAGGWRLGFFALPKIDTYIKNHDPNYNQIKQNRLNLIKAISARYSEQSSCVNSPTQYAAMAAFDFNKNQEIEEYCQITQLLNRASGYFLYEKFNELEIKVFKPQGAFYVFPDFENFRQKMKEKYNITTSIDLAKCLLENFYIASLPGTAFGVPSDHLVLRIATIDYNSEEALEGAKKDYQLLTEHPIQFATKYMAKLTYGIKQINKFVDKIN